MSELFPLFFFICPSYKDGKMYSFLSESLAKQNLIQNLINLRNAARAAHFPILYAPHRNFRNGDYDDWKHLTPTQQSAKASRFSELGSSGAEFHKDLLAQSGDIVVSNHWSTSGFANTDLDHQLKRHGIEYVVVCGLEALTCVVSTKEEKGRRTGILEQVNFNCSSLYSFSLFHHVRRTQVEMQSNLVTMLP